MRILIVDVNYEYKNPMYRQFYTSLFNCMEVDYFGPGYVSRECLEKGILQYLFENIKYDAILLGAYFISPNVYYTHRCTIPYYNVNDAYQCCGRVLEELNKVRDVIKIFLNCEDYMAMSIDYMNRCREFIENGFYILSWPMEYMKKYNDELMSQHSCLSNYAYELAEEYKEYYIPVSFHGLGYNEIFVRNFSDRNYDWCVPGNRAEFYYPERNKAWALVESNSKKIWNDDPFQELSVTSINKKHMEWYQFRNKTEKLLSWIWKKDYHISSHPKVEYIAACREKYLESMRSTKFVYAEGGIGNCFVRKYFEACACGAVLVAKRVPGMDEMGFVNGKNCIIVDKYDEIVDIDNKYTHTQLEQIAKNGQKLIIDKHMFVHRAKALAQTIEIILHSAYQGAFWKNGNYVIKQ